MEQNVVQHHEFLPALETFGQYAQACLDKKKSFDASQFIGLMDTFAPKLSTHLEDEIKTLRGLGKYKDNVKEIKKAYMALAADAQQASKVGSCPYMILFGHGRLIDFSYRRQSSRWFVVPAIQHMREAVRGPDSHSLYRIWLITSLLESIGLSGGLTPPPCKESRALSSSCRVKSRRRFLWHSQPPQKLTYVFAWLAF